MILQTDRLRLRELDSEDSAFILKLVNDPDWLRHIGDRGVRSLRDASDFIEEGPLASYSEHGYGLWLVETKDGSSPIGLCGVLKRRHLEQPDLGYALLPDYRGMGYATEACKGVLEYAKRKLGLEQVLAVVAPRNRRSVGLLEKLGYQAVGTTSMPQGERVLLFRLDLRAQQA